MNKEDHDAWEALCRRCGRCCFEKIECDGEVYYTDRITSYNVCYTKLLRPLVVGLEKLHDRPLPLRRAGHHVPDLFESFRPVSFRFPGPQDIQVRSVHEEDPKA